MNRSQYRCCPICGATEQEIIATHDYPVLFESRDNHHTYVECGGCGMVFSGDPIEGEARTNYYDSAQRWAHIFKSVPESSARRWQDQLDFMAGSGMVFDRFLEIGSGPGYLLKMIEEQFPGSRAEGFDINGAACRFGREYLGLSMFWGEDISLAELADDNTFTAISLRHVMEHIVDPVPMLKDSAALLDRDGLLFVEVWAWDVLDSHAQPFPVYEHVNYFTVTTMARLLAEAGLATELVQTVVYGAESDMPYRAIRFMASPTPSATAPSDQRVARAESFRSHLVKFDQVSPARQRLKAFLAKSGISKLVMYSASLETVRLLRSLSSGEAERFVAVLDANPAKQGNNLESLPVLAPSELDSLGVEFVVIGSSGFQENIRDQLLRDGVTEERIVLLWDMPESQKATS